MLYKMIATARDRWYQSPECTVNSVIEYIASKGQMRDAQVDAIKTYLYLKIACANRPLADLFISGTFNSLSIDDLEVSAHTRDFLNVNPAAAALYEYVTYANDKGDMVSEKTAKVIVKQPETIDYEQVFRDIFYGVSYPDYLFSLPMGAGKTWLMAAFIYLDLYYAMNEPENLVFAHNFIIFAPSGLKSSVVPSLRTIQNFDPAWIIPEPAASSVKRMIKFEVLDQGKTAKKSNKTRNPNVQKVANNQPLNELMGLVIVTNAEKVILDRMVEKNGQISFMENSEDDDDRQANELRNLIGKLPSLAVYIDEVHHAVKSEIKLRAVVNRWTSTGAINGVIGFSGTPYLEKPEKITVTAGLSISSAEIANIVYYYPLINGIGNFLKRPIVKVLDNASSAEIVERGIRTFLDSYKDTIYATGQCAKLAVYCGRIEKLETIVLPIAERVTAEYGLNPSECILKYYEKSPADDQLAFASLDLPFSKIRIVLLVQIGKEGWDCRSLTGIILSQEGDCHKTMVLQTSCRCLRQVIKGSPETALIYLNGSNAAKLNEQLEQQHHISLQEFEHGPNSEKTPLLRYDRTGRLQLPKLDYYQLKVSYSTVTEETVSTAEGIANAKNAAYRDLPIEYTGDLSDLRRSIDDSFVETGTTNANYSAWTYGIAKESLGFVTTEMLREHDEALKRVFRDVTYEKDGRRFFSSKYNLSMLGSAIRKAFYTKRSFNSIEELIPLEASLLKVENFTSTIETDLPTDYFPDAAGVAWVKDADENGIKSDPKDQAAIDGLEAIGQHDMAETLRMRLAPFPMKDKTFHYLPYHTDSSFEQTFLNEVMKQASIKNLGLEVYYNGDSFLTEFSVRCFKRIGGKWKYIGIYTPDFLIIERRDDKIYRAIIVETKGKIYASDPAFIDKRSFTENEFVGRNNEMFGYRRFEYLYLEDTLTVSQRIEKTAAVIQDLFKEEH